MTKSLTSNRVLKHIFFPALLVTLLAFPSKSGVRVNASPTIITTKASDTYINNYYSSISDTLTGDSLASALETRLKAERNNSFSYGSLQTSAFPYIDVDPTRPNDGYIVSFYSGTAVKGYSGMNKEHTWPNSHGGNKIENDPHMVRPTISAENSSRGNEYFSNTAAGWDPASLGDVQARGMSARIILYGAVIGKSSGLVLEDVGRGQGTGTGNKMGKLSDLLRWNLEYPVNQKEIIRNETLDISLDYNRNPFIDRPQYACQIWGDTNANTQSICATQTPVDVTSVSVSPTAGTINMLSATKGMQLNATVLPVNASNKNVTWSSSNNSVATVSASGYVTGHSVGHATIFATSAENANKKGQAAIEVISATIPVTGITLNKSTTTIEVGKNETLVATVLPSGATNKTITWTSSNATVATVNNGVISGIKKGSATITARTNDGNFTAAVTVTVVEAAPVVVINGSFYNTTTGNSGGDVTGDDTFKNLMNNGQTSGNAFSGFGGNTVISDLTATQRYLPRGGGLALGSGSNAGTLKITLNSAYAANKVEVFINGSVSGATASLATNVTPKSNVVGTNGTQFSNPSTGTPYVLEFNEVHNYFEINTTKRMIVVAIRLTIGDDTIIAETPEESATNWSSNFLALTSEGCALSDRNLLLTAWNNAANDFMDLSSEAQDIIIDAAPIYSEVDVITHAKSRYLVILNQYQLNDFIYNEVAINSHNQIHTNLMSDTIIFIGVSLSLIGFGLTTGQFKRIKIR